MVSVYFGSIGCGKTTVACKLLRKSRKRYDHFFTTFKTLDLKNCHQWQNFEGLGLVTPPEHSLLVDDESGITYNNRKYKSGTAIRSRFFYYLLQKKSVESAAFAFLPTIVLSCLLLRSSGTGEGATWNR